MASILVPPTCYLCLETIVSCQIPTSQRSGVVAVFIYTPEPLCLVVCFSHAMPAIQLFVDNDSINTHAETHIHIYPSARRAAVQIGRAHV